MAKQLLAGFFLLFGLFWNNNAFCQKGKGSKADNTAGDASPSTSSSTSSSVMPGFVYQIPYKYHLKYKTTKVLVRKIKFRTPSRDTDYQLKLHQVYWVRSWSYTSNYQMEDADHLYSVKKVHFDSVAHLKFDSIGHLKPVNIQHLWIGDYQKTLDTLINLKYNVPCCKIKPPDSLVNYIETTTEVDTLDRYYNKKSNFFANFFGLSRLHASISPAPEPELVSDEELAIA